MSHENEYHDEMVQLLELIWGEGYMAPGGPGNIAKLFRDLDTHDKRVLDIGCGIGGPAREMASTHGAIVTGIDLEAPLVERANADTVKAGLDDRCRFMTVEAGPLTFADETFDIVVSSGALTQTADKAGMFDEIRRVLVPGGWFTCYDWMRIDQEYSEDMLYWFKLEGLTYEMETIEGQARLMREAGFEEVESEDASDWYRQEAKREYELLKDKLYPTMVEMVDQAYADEYVEDWRALVVILEAGEMRQGYFRGRKPVV